MILIVFQLDSWLRTDPEEQGDIGRIGAPSTDDTHQGGAHMRTQSNSRLAYQKIFRRQRKVREMIEESKKGRQLMKHPH